VASVTELTIPGDIRLRIYTPAGGPERRPVLAWIHGGGFILGDLYTAGGTCRALANRSGAIVVAVEYRLAPEHPLTAGHDDCLAAVRWLSEHADEIGGSSLAVGGDSAGGALAAVVAQRCAEEGIELALQVLVYPATDLAGEYPSNIENGDGLMLSSENIEWIRAHIRQVSDLADPELSPLLTDDVSNVAPAVIVTAGFDPIRDEGLAYGEKLREAGVPVRSLHYPDQVHGFLSFDRVIHGARDALDRIGAIIAGDVLDDGVYETRANPLRHLSPTTVAQRYNETRVTQVIVAEWLQQQAFKTVSRSWRLAVAVTPWRVRPRRRP
jgi:acetyl esterase